jgi:putative hydrolase of the HAD superfamily
MKSLLCDIGGVLLKVDFSVALKALSRASGIGEEEIKRRIFLSGIKDKHDLGLITPLDFYRQVITNEEIPFSVFKTMWNGIFRENREVVEYVQTLAADYRLFIASNTDPIHYDCFISQYPWFSMFQGMGLSFRLKSMKPSPEFYLKLCREFGIDFRDALFVDDLRENVEAANRLGIRSHLFSGLDGFKRFLEDARS